MPRVWHRPQRNYDGIENESPRRVVDPDYNDLHDELSEAYYTGQPYRDRGILDKATFDQLHGLCFHHHALELHAEHRRQNPTADDGTAVAKARTALNKTKNRGKSASEVAEAEGIHPLLASALDAEAAIADAKGRGHELRFDGRTDRVA